MEKLAVKILVIDDDPNISKLIRFYLESELYSITTVQNGQQGILLAGKEDFDLILVDMFMPRMDGLTFLQKLKQAGYNESPVIMVTAIDLDDEKLQNMIDDIFDVLTKPFTANRLKLTIRNALRYRRLQHKYTSLINSVIKE